MNLMESALIMEDSPIKGTSQHKTELNTLTGDEKKTQSLVIIIQN